jgi:hypothetical protein
MDLGQHYLQIISSGVMILGAACVALMFDFLKKNNEQLRELVEVTVRQEEAQMRSPVVTRPVPKPAPKVAHVALAPKNQPAIRRHSPRWLGARRWRCPVNGRVLLRRP